MGPNTSRIFTVASFHLGLALLNVTQLWSPGNRTGRHWKSGEGGRKVEDAEAPLSQARHQIYEGLMRATEQTLAKAKHKLIVENQLDQIRLIFGGGGHCEYPYKAAVMHSFSGTLFRQAISPDTLGMPVPYDLELETGQTRWMRRLSVAYGLSFEKSELSTFSYPVEMESPTAEEIWKPFRKIPGAPGKDESNRNTTLTLAI